MPLFCFNGSFPGLTEPGKGAVQVVIVVVQHPLCKIVPAGFCSGVLETGVYKVLHPRWVGSLSSLLGENIKILKEEKEYHGCREEYYKV